MRKIKEDTYRKFDGIFIPVNIANPLLRVGIRTIADIYECDANGFINECGDVYTNLLSVKNLGQDRILTLSNLLVENGYRPLVDEVELRNKIPKETPRKVIVLDEENKKYICPRCNDNNSVLPCLIARYDYCYYCGQHLDWGDIKGFYRGKDNE